MELPLSWNDTRTGRYGPDSTPLVRNRTLGEEVTGIPAWAHIFLWCLQDVIAIEWQENVHRMVTPVGDRTGGYVPETEVRQKQQQMQAQAKYQKMLQREEHKKKEKAKEDAKIQRMKDIQRQKAENLKEKQKQQEQTRQIQWQDDRYLRNNAFLDHVSQQYDSYPVYDEHEAHSSVWARRESYRQQQKQEEEMKLQAMKAEQRQKSEMLEFEQRQKEENARQRHHENHKRVNNAFLDRLEQRNTANTSQNKYCGVKNEWN
uniref:Epithelial stromal interaction 1 n=1 Tax=Leptobrachium leishanense TaxID=445787 RepID=A0A8C5Q2B2_9ANUR